MRVAILTGIIISILLTGCTKDFTLKADKNRPNYVIEGRVTNLKGPYYVRVTRVSDLDIAKTPDYWDSQTKNGEPVRDAQVIIWDEAGAIDTLKPVLQESTPRYYYQYMSNPIRIDSSITNYLQPLYRDNGYYCTTRLTGIAGHTYHLKVIIGEEVFEASAYMPPAPVLDSANFQPIGQATDGRTIYLPYAYFREPQAEQNYYLFQYYNSIFDYPYDYAHISHDDQKIFPYYVMDDSVLPGYVNGVQVKYTYSLQGSYANQDAFANWAGNMPSQVRLFALTKETYNYYKQLIKQFENDGTVYKPAPATPVGNISNNAIGLFYAAGASYALIMPK
jgi:hypothetical protein